MRKILFYPQMVVPIAAISLAVMCLYLSLEGHFYFISANPSPQHLQVTRRGSLLVMDIWHKAINQRPKIFLLGEEGVLSYCTPLVQLAHSVCRNPYEIMNVFEWCRIYNEFNDIVTIRSALDGSLPFSI